MLAAPGPAGTADSRDWGRGCPTTSPLSSQCPSPPSPGAGGWPGALGGGSSSCAGVGAELPPEPPSLRPFFSRSSRSCRNKPAADASSCPPSPQRHPRPPGAPLAARHPPALGPFRGRCPLLIPTPPDRACVSPPPPARDTDTASPSTLVFLKPVTGKSVLSTKKIITNLWPPPPSHPPLARGGLDPLPSGGPPRPRPRAAAAVCTGLCSDVQGGERWGWGSECRHGVAPPPHAGSSHPPF